MALELSESGSEGIAVTIDALSPGSYSVELSHGSNADGLHGSGRVEIVARERSELEIVVSPADGLVQAPGIILMESAQEARRVERVRVSRPGGRIPLQPGMEAGEPPSPRSTFYGMAVGESISREGAVLQWEDLWLHPGEHVLRIEPQEITWVVRIEDHAVQPLYLSLESFTSIEVGVIREDTGESVSTLHAFSNMIVLDEDIHTRPEQFTAGGKHEEWQVPLTMRIPMQGIAVLGTLSEHHAEPLSGFHVIDPLAGPKQTIRLQMPCTIDLEVWHYGEPQDAALSWWTSVRLEDSATTRKAPAAVGVITRGEGISARRVRLGFEGLGAGPFVLHLPARAGRGASAIALPQGVSAIVVDHGLKLARARQPEDG